MNNRVRKYCTAVRLPAMLTFLLTKATSSLGGTGLEGEWILQLTGGVGGDGREVDCVRACLLLPPELTVEFSFLLWGRGFTPHFCSDYLRSALGG